MSHSDTFLAIFCGSMQSPAFAAWVALPEAERKAREQAGMAAWHAWMEKHRDAIVSPGGPLGKTKKVAADGVHDTSNHLSGFTVVRAPSHAEAAALFVDHPHFAIFPGDSVEIMPVMPIPTF